MLDLCCRFLTFRQLISEDFPLIDEDEPTCMKNDQNYATDYEL